MARGGRRGVVATDGWSYFVKWMPFKDELIKKGIYAVNGSGKYSLISNMQDIGMNSDIKREKDRFTNELISKYFKIEDDIDNVIHSKPQKGGESNLKAPGFEWQCELLIKTIESIANDANNHKYEKRFHQTGYTFNKDLFISQIMDNLDNDLIEFGTLKSIGLPALKTLDATEVAQAKGVSKPGRKSKDIGKASRIYSKEEAGNVASLVSSDVINTEDATKFDRVKYFSNIDKTALVITEFMKEDFKEELPLKKNAIVAAQIETRKKILKYLESLDIYKIYCKALTCTINNNNNNNNNSNSNTNSNSVEWKQIINKKEFETSLKALNNGIELEKHIWKWKIKNNFKKLTAKKKEKLTKEFLARKKLDADALEMKKDKELKRKAQEKQEFKIKEKVKKHHTMWDFFKAKQ